MVFIHSCNHEKICFVIIMIDKKLLAQFSVGIILAGAISNFLGDLEDTILTPNVRYVVDKQIGNDRKIAEIDINKLLTQFLNLMIVILFFTVMVKFGITPLWAKKK